MSSYPDIKLLGDNRLDGETSRISRSDQSDTVPGNKSDPTWISEMIGTTLEQASNAIALLEAKDLIRVQRGRMSQTGRTLYFVEPPPSREMVLSKQKILERGIRTLESVPDERQLSLVGHIPVDPDDLPEIGKMIWSFSKKLRRRAANPRSLYYFTVQLFPIHDEKQ